MEGKGNGDQEIRKKTSFFRTGMADGRCVDSTYSVAGIGRGDRACCRADTDWGVSSIGGAGECAEQGSVRPGGE